MPNNRPRLPITVVALLGLAVALSAALLFDLSPWLRGDLDWRWPYRLAPALHTRLPWVLLVFGGYLAAAAGLWRWAAGDRNGRRPWLAAAAASVLMAVLLVTTQYIREPDPIRELHLRTASPFTQGYNDTALGIDNLGVYLARFDEIAPTYAVPHVERHPPGFVTLAYGVRQLMQRVPQLADPLAATMQRYRCEYWPYLYLSNADYATTAAWVLPLLLAALLPLVTLAGFAPLLPRQHALLLALLTPLTPGYLVWGGHWDGVLPLVTLAVVGLVGLALRHGRTWAWLLAGLTVGVALFFNHSMLTLIPLTALLAGLLLLPDWRDWLTRWRTLLAGAALFWGGMVLPWLLYWAAFGLTWLDIYRANTTPHYDETSNYWLRLFYNPYDFYLFAGYVLALLGGWALLRMARRALARQPFTPAQLVVLAFWLTLAALTLSGVARAEVGRVWVFLTPLALLAATLPLLPGNDDPGDTAHDDSPRGWLLLAAALALHTVAVQAALFGDSLWYSDYRFDTTAAPAVDAQLGDGIALLDYSLSATTAAPGDTISLGYRWRSSNALPADLTVFTHLFGESGGMAAQFDGPPAKDPAPYYPTTCWLPGEVVTYTVTLTIAPDTAPGSYALLAGMYDPASGARLPATGPAASPDNALQLGTVTVTP